MKVLIVVALLVVVSVNATRSKFHDDIDEFAALIPQDEIQHLIEKYMMYDQQFQEVMMYIQTSPAGREAMEAMMNMPEIQALQNWILEHLFDSGPIMHRRPRSVGKDLGGFNGFFEEVKRIFPVEKWLALGRKKIAEGGVFAEFYKQLQGIKDIFEKLMEIPSYAEFMNHLKELGVDVDAMNDFNKKLLGWD